MSSTPESVFEAIAAYIYQVLFRQNSPTEKERRLTLLSFLAQAPTYHIVLEAILVAWIVYLVFFSKQYRPETKHDKLTKEVCVLDSHTITTLRDPEHFFPLRKRML